MNSDLLVEHARVALAKYHNSPASFRLYRGEKATSGTVSFEDPDQRSVITLEREDFVEKGAILMAGLLLSRFEKMQITRVVPRGGRVDYFVGNRSDDFACILEVGGTDAGSFEARRSQKLEQFLESPYRQKPHSKEGFVAATRCAPAAASSLDYVPAVP